MRPQDASRSDLGTRADKGEWTDFSGCVDDGVRVHISRRMYPRRERRHGVKELRHTSPTLIGRFGHERYRRAWHAVFHIGMHDDGARKRSLERRGVSAIVEKADVGCACILERRDPRDR